MLIAYSLLIGLLIVKDSFFLPLILDIVKLSLDMFPEPSVTFAGEGSTPTVINFTVSELLISLGNIHSPV